MRSGGFLPRTAQAQSKQARYHPTNNPELRFNYRQKPQQISLCNLSSPRWSSQRHLIFWDHTTIQQFYHHRTTKHESQNGLFFFTAGYKMFSKCSSTAISIRVSVWASMIDPISVPPRPLILHWIAVGTYFDSTGKGPPKGVSLIAYWDVGS